VARLHANGGRVRHACYSMSVSPSSFYEWKTRALRRGAIRHACLTSLIEQVHEASYGTYGQPRVVVRLNPVARHVALLARLRDGHLVARPSFFQLHDLRQARRRGALAPDRARGRPDLPQPLDASALPAQEAAWPSAAGRLLLYGASPAACLPGRTGARDRAVAGERRLASACDSGPAAKLVPGQADLTGRQESRMDTPGPRREASLARRPPGETPPRRALRHGGAGPSAPAWHSRPPPAPERRW
jgi:hypothetical protein